MRLFEKSPETDLAKGQEDKLGPALLIDQSARIGTEEVRKAAAVLRKYKDGKANLERRVVEDER